MPPPSPLRVGFVVGTTPDRWAGRFRERTDQRLDLVVVEEADQERAVREGEVDMVLARLPVDRTELHCIRLYEEQAVVVVGLDHVLTILEEVDLADLADEQLVHPERSGWTPQATQLAWPSTDLATAVETVASGTGIVVVPQSLARLHQRRDVTYRPVHGLPGTEVGLVWRVDHDPPGAQGFIGVVRGRTARSSRG